MSADRTRPRPAVRRLAVASSGAALAAVLLAGCASGGDAASSSGAQAAGPSSSAATGGLDLGDRVDQRRAEAAAARAASFGFTRQDLVGADQIAAARADAADRAADDGRATVEPARCQAPLAALDFSPILLDQEEVTRVDVGTDSFAGTGTVEVATLDGPGRQRVEEHLQTVNTLLADCRDMTVTTRDADGARTYRLQMSAADLSDGSPAQSGLVWTQTPAGQDEPATAAQILTAVGPEEVVMVSFTGQPQAAERQFTVMAEEMLAAAGAVTR